MEKYYINKSSPNIGYVVEIKVHIQGPNKMSF
jgi:hypothetical protein